MNIQGSHRDVQKIQYTGKSMIFSIIEFTGKLQGRSKIEYTGKSIILSNIEYTGKWKTYSINWIYKEFNDIFKYWVYREVIEMSKHWIYREVYKIPLAWFIQQYYLTSKKKLLPNLIPSHLVNPIYPNFSSLRNIIKHIITEIEVWNR